MTHTKDFAMSRVDNRYHESLAAALHVISLLFDSEIHSFEHTAPWTLTNVLTYILTYLFTPRSGVLLEKLTGVQLVKKFPAFYGT